MREVTVAIVGAGGMAREHVRAFASLPNVKVAGLTSRTRAKADALASELGIPVVADSIDELHALTNADLVIVAVPELSANPVAIKTFAHPWAVLMEKPAGYDLTDAETIAAAARGRSAPVMVGLNRRFYSSARSIKADLESRPGEKRFIHVQDQQSYEEARRYNHPPQVVEKFMYANSIHLIDLIPFFARGKVSRVQQVTPWRGEETEVMIAYVEFDSGDTALYEGLWKGPGPWAANVSTRGKRWIMQPLEDAIYQNAGERARHTIERSDEDKQFKPGFLLQAKAAVARVRGEASTIASIEDSLQTMRLINQMFDV
ncbi:MAG TPA: Gfo/Idh/MocA family oxidoreductase [Vicinamibacterales bacterium]